MSSSKESTLSDKREARKEELLRKLQKNPAMRRGYVAKADQDGKGFLGWQKASTITENGVSYLKEEPSANTLGFSPPPIIKRTAQQRVESLTQRLLAHMEETYRVYGEPRIPADLLESIKGEYWKAGAPHLAEEVTVETLRAIAAQALNEAELRQKYEKKNPNRSK